MKYTRSWAVGNSGMRSLSSFSASLVSLLLKQHLLITHLAFGPKWSQALTSQQFWCSIHAADNYFCVSYFEFLRVSAPRSGWSLTSPWGFIKHADSWGPIPDGSIRVPGQRVVDSSISVWAACVTAADGVPRSKDTAVARVGGFKRHMESAQVVMVGNTRKHLSQGSFQFILYLP